MSSAKIPQEVRQQVEKIIDQFNRQVLKDPNYFYSARYRGSYLYTDRHDYGVAGPICRLKYTGDMDNWEFAIFKWSDERYDPDEWFFPGVGFVDGTIEGALKAGLEAYPF